MSSSSRVLEFAKRMRELTKEMEYFINELKREEIERRDKTSAKKLAKRIRRT